MKEVLKIPVEEKKPELEFKAGLPTGFYSLDELTAGLHSGELIIIAGRPCMGKTSFAMNIVEHVAITLKKTVLVFSMEMSNKAYVKRLISSLGAIEQNNMEVIKEVTSFLNTKPEVNSLLGRKLIVDDNVVLTCEEMGARVRHLINKKGKINLIVVDYLQLMSDSIDDKIRTAELSDMTRSLKALAKELKIPIIALSQLKRNIEQRADKRPVMSDLIEAGVSEQSADLILFLYRDEIYNDNSPDKGKVEVIIAKQRNGHTGKIDIRFLGKYLRFVNFQAGECS